jgi:hypothetical protein
MTHHTINAALVTAAIWGSFLLVALFVVAA